MFKNHMINFIYIPYFDSVTLNIEYWCDNFKLLYIIVRKIKQTLLFIYQLERSTLKIKYKKTNKMQV